LLRLQRSWSELQLAGKRGVKGSGKQLLKQFQCTSVIPLREQHVILENHQLCSRSRCYVLQTLLLVVPRSAFKSLFSPMLLQYRPSS
jgi:hypothetical protein